MPRLQQKKWVTSGKNPQRIFKQDISTTVKSLFLFCFVLFCLVSQIFFLSSFFFSPNDVLEKHPTSPWSHSCRAHDTVNNFCLLSWPFRLTIHQICSHLWGVNKTITRKPFTTVMDSRSKQETCFLQRDNFNRKQNWGRTMRRVWISLYKFYKNNPSKCLRRENLLKTEQTLWRLLSFLRFSFKAALKWLYKRP